MTVPRYISEQLSTTIVIPKFRGLAIYNNIIYGTNCGVANKVLIELHGSLVILKMLQMVRCGPVWLIVRPILLAYKNGLRNGVDWPLSYVC